MAARNKAFVTPQGLMIREEHGTVRLACSF
jgi:hypothetical protein